MGALRMCLDPGLNVSAIQLAHSTQMFKDVPSTVPARH